MVNWSSQNRDYAANKPQAEDTLDGIAEEEKANVETLTEAKPLVDVAETVTAPEELIDF